MAKSTRLNLRVTSADDALFREGATCAQENLTEFLVESGRERAARLLADRNSFVLDDRQWKAFADSLESPPRSNERLADLLRRPRPE